jgi:transcriptional regulator with XRE-family HTH domain
LTLIKVVYIIYGNGDKGRESPLIFDERLIQCRKAKNITQTGIAEKLGLTYQAYSHYEKGRSTPPLDILIQIADILDVSIDYLTGRVDDPRLKVTEVDGMRIEHNKDSVLTPEQIEQVKRIIAEERNRDSRSDK